MLKKGEPAEKKNTFCTHLREGDKRTTNFYSRKVYTEIVPWFGGSWTGDLKRRGEELFGDFV